MLLRVLFRERGSKDEMASCVGKFHTNVVAVAGSCQRATGNGEIWVRSWENSTPTLRLLLGHVHAFFSGQRAFGDFGDLLV